jgi:GNAT superfamily N-acetyltransferase
VETVITHAEATDAGRIITLVRLQYGELNYDKTLYDSERLAEGISTGKYRFWIATYDGNDAGMVCLKGHPYFSGTYEGCTLTVLPQYRRHGIAKMLMDKMREVFGSLRAESVFYSVLTTSLTEQNREYKNGFIPTGFALNRFLFDKTAPNLTVETTPLRRHHLYMVMPIEKRETAKLFIPPETETYVKLIYSQLGVSIGDETIKAAPSETAIYSEHDYTDYYGCMPDGNATGFANVFLDMTDSETPKRYENLRQQGWHFTGIKPLQTEAEYLIMHKGDITAINSTVTLPAFDTAKAIIRGIDDV